MSARTLPAMHSGWAYSLDGTAVAFVMEPERPETGQFVAFDSWWAALHYAVVYATIHPRCEYIGGPNCD